MLQLRMFAHNKSINKAMDSYNQWSKEREEHDREVHD